MMGVGKSTVGRIVAAELDRPLFDSDEMIRAITWLALEADVPLEDAVALTAMAEANPVTFDYADDAPIATSVKIAGSDVTAAIRYPVVDANVSAVSAVPGVRAALVRQQRLLADRRDTVAEGRDIGTVVFPHAAVKVFLTATAEERARRRQFDLANQGHAVEQEEVQARLEKRDAYDSTREVSPLEAAPDAELLDTTGLSIEQVVDGIVERVEAAR
jgi:cytidylate kinase